jgi:hypothetical protein
MGASLPYDRISTEQMWANFRQYQDDVQRRIEENAERIKREFGKTATLQEAIDAGNLDAAEAALRAAEHAAAWAAAQTEQPE